MAKDRRTNGRSTRRAVSKVRFIVRLAVALAAVAIVVVSLIMAFSSLGKSNSNTDVSTATTASRDTATASTTLLTTASTSTSASTSTTTTMTTTTTTTTATALAASAGVTDILLVNPWNTISREEIDALPLVHYSDGYYVHEEALASLKAMVKAASAYNLYVTSAYRSYDTQQSLYENKVQRVINATGMSYEDALVEAATVVARPGTSEHHTGLAIDFLHKDCRELEEYWDQSPAFDWMVEHCAEYGFILRYPKEKQHITGVIYEPWHYRYVGERAAKEIMARGITLEEYLGQA